MNTTYVILGCGISSVIFRYVAGFAFRKPSARLALLQANMPMLIMVSLVALLYKDLNYSTPPFALDYLIAGIIALLIRIISKNAVLAIVISTACFVGMHDYLLKGLG